MEHVNGVAPRHFRNVLGHFPTGVAVVTAVDPDDRPIGMAVGSFTSVSLDPPLVAFLPDRNSSTFPAIRAAGRFCVNVLAGGQEALSRVFATKGTDRFSTVAWHPAPHTGAPVLDGAVAWIDCELGDIHDAGDHYIVIGKVLGLNVQTPTLPLLFFQGGYGTFAPPRSLVLASEGRLREAIGIAETARADLERLSAEVGLEARVVARDGDRLVIVATAGHADGADPVGAFLPYYPPFGAIVAAWYTPEQREEWYDAFPVRIEPEQRKRLDAALDRIRERGWAVMFRSDASTEVERLVEALAEYGPTPDLERRLFEAGAQMSGFDDPGSLDDANAGSVRSLTAPVIGPDGPVLHLTLYGFSGDVSLAFVEHARNRLVETARAVSASLGGRPS